MADHKVIAVVGSTGAQGGGLARAILDNPAGGFAVRALTRNPGSVAAKALADRGAEIVKADLEDQASLVKAFDGAYGVFGVTNYWELFSVEREQAQAANIASASVEAKVHHVIWSTLEDSREHIPLADDRMPTLMGSYKVPHFDSKGESDRFFAEAGVRRISKLGDSASRGASVRTGNRMGAPTRSPTWRPLSSGRTSPTCFSEVRMACWRSRCRWAMRACRASRSRTSD